MMKLFPKLPKEIGNLMSRSRLHTLGITGILNICCHITTMDDNTF